MLNTSILCRSRSLNITKRPLAVQGAILLNSMLSIPDDNGKSKLNYSFIPRLCRLGICAAQYFLSASY